MLPICNDVLTRIAVPRWGRSADTEVVYRIGDKGDKNGMPYTVKAFGTYFRRVGGVPQVSKENPSIVYLVIKYRGDRNHKWDCLLIGDTNSFRERLVFGGRHPNPIFDQYWPAGEVQPI